MLWLKVAYYYIKTHTRINHDLCSCRGESYINYESHNSVKYRVSIALSGLIIAHCKTVQRTFQEHTRTCQWQVHCTGQWNSKQVSARRWSHGIWETLKRSAFTTWHFCNCCKILTSAPKEFMFVLYNNVVIKVIKSDMLMLLCLWSVC